MEAAQCRGHLQASPAPPPARPPRPHLGSRCGGQPGGQATQRGLAYRSALANTREVTGCKGLLGRLAFPHFLRGLCLGAAVAPSRVQPSFPDTSQFSAQPQSSSPTSGTSCPRGCGPAPHGGPVAGAAPPPTPRGPAKPGGVGPACCAGQVAGPGCLVDTARTPSVRAGAGQVPWGLCPLGSRGPGLCNYSGPPLLWKTGPHLRS